MGSFIQSAYNRPLVYLFRVTKLLFFNLLCFVTQSLKNKRRDDTKSSMKGAPPPPDIIVVCFLLQSLLAHVTNKSLDVREKFNNDGINIEYEQQH